jgi:hypothetical protein
LKPEEEAVSSMFEVPGKQTATLSLFGTKQIYQPNYNLNKQK